MLPPGAGGKGSAAAPVVQHPGEDVLGGITQRTDIPGCEAYGKVIKSR